MLRILVSVALKKWQVSFDAQCIMYIGLHELQKPSLLIAANFIHKTYPPCIEWGTCIDLSLSGYHLLGQVLGRKMSHWFVDDTVYQGNHYPQTSTTKWEKWRNLYLVLTLRQDVRRIDCIIGPIIKVNSVQVKFANKSNNRLSRMSKLSPFFLCSLFFYPIGLLLQVKFSQSRSYFFSPSGFDLGRVDCNTVGATLVQHLFLLVGL